MRTKGLILCIMIACFLLSGCGLGEKESAAPGQETSPETGPLSPAKAEDYPFDRLGVMLSETRLGPVSEEGRVISEAEFQSLPEENEIRLRYVNGKGEAGAIYSFTFQEPDSIAKDVYPLNVVLMDQGNLYVSDGMHYGGDRSYLYQYSAGLAYRPLTQEERAHLGAPMAYIKGYDNREERMGQQDLFVLTEDGHVVAGAWDGKAYWSDWAALGNQELYISREPLPEMVRMHLVALGMRYLLESDASLEPLVFPSEEWSASLEAEGQVKEMTGAEAISLAQLLGYPHPDREAETEAWGQHLSEVMAQPEGALKFTVSDGSGQPYRADGTAGDTALYISPQGVLAAEMPGLRISPAGGEACFQIRGKVYARLKDPADPALYEQLKAWNPGDLAPWALYPFDWLGVMTGEGRTGPIAEEGKVIDGETFQAPSQPGEVKVIYLYSEWGSATDYYSFSFDGADGEASSTGLTMQLAINGLGGWATLWESGPILSPAELNYLYHYTACRSFRSLEAGEEAALSKTLPLCVLMEDPAGGSRDFFAMNEEGYLLHAPGEGMKEWPLWQAEGDKAVFDAVSREPLPEAVRLHLAALVVRYLSTESSVNLPYPVGSSHVSSQLPEEYWSARLMLGEQERFLSGRDVLALNALYPGGTLGNIQAWGLWQMRPESESLEEAIRLTVIDGLEESFGDGAIRDELYILPDGSLLMEQRGFFASVHGENDGFSLRASLMVTLDRKVPESFYQELKAMIPEAASAELPQKTVPLIRAQRREAQLTARPEWSLPRVSETGEVLYDENSLLADLAADMGEMLILDRGRKGLIFFTWLEEENELRNYSLDFCTDPCRLLREIDTVCVLDREAVWIRNGKSLSDKEKDWERIPLPEGVTAQQVEDMVLDMGDYGQELVLIGREGVSYSLPFEGEGEERVFSPTELGYHRENDRIRRNGVSWEMPSYEGELQILEADSSSLALCQIQAEQKVAFLRQFMDWRQAPAGEIVGEIGRVDMSDWLLIPEHFVKNSVLMAPKAEKLDIYWLTSYGSRNVLSEAADPCYQALEHAAGEGAEKLEQTEMEEIELFAGEACRLLLSEYEDPRDADMAWMMTDLLIDRGRQEFDWTTVYDSQEREAVDQALGLNMKADQKLMKYRTEDLKQVLQQYLGLSLEDMSQPQPGVYAESYDAWYFAAPGKGTLPIRFLTGRKTAEGHVLLLWEGSYGEKAGLAEIVKTEEGWHFLSNHFLEE